MEKLMPTVETLEWPVKAMERIEDSCRKRGHATGWHAPNEFQDRMEVEATKDTDNIRVEIHAKNSA